MLCGNLPIIEIVHVTQANARVDPNCQPVAFMLGWQHLLVSQSGGSGH